MPALTTERCLPKQEPSLQLAVQAQPGKQRYPEDIVITRVPDNDGKDKAKFADRFCWVFLPTDMLRQGGMASWSPSYLGDTEVRSLL